ncbi:MAG: ATP synthase F1 subunit delta [Polyangiaceae bacterium]|nr:ATP synthase F1 subunit delta [Polyangiaceae bacterium]
MIPGVIAKRYAAALLELGSEAGQLDALVDELGRAAEAYESSRELRSAFEDPLLSASAKKAIMHEVSDRLGLGVTAKNALALLVDRRRVRALPAIAVRLRELADQKRGIVRAEVLAAMPLSEDYFVRLQRELERVTGRRIALDRKIDPSLLCGVVVRVGDTVFDGSLVARLHQMKEAMIPN